MFACLELDYEDADADETGEAALEAQQHLTYYELDLGLNHVVRKHSENLDEPGTSLLAIPGGTDGPGGLLLIRVVPGAGPLPADGRKIVPDRV